MRRRARRPDQPSGSRSMIRRRSVAGVRRALGGRAEPRTTSTGSVICRSTPTRRLRRTLATGNGRAVVPAALSSGSCTTIALRARFRSAAADSRPASCASAIPCAGRQARIRRSCTSCWATSKPSAQCRPAAAPRRRAGPRDPQLPRRLGPAQPRPLPRRGPDHGGAAAARAARRDRRQRARRRGRGRLPQRPLALQLRLPQPPPGRIHPLRPRRARAAHPRHRLPGVAVDDLRRRWPAHRPASPPPAAHGRRLRPRRPRPAARRGDGPPAGEPRPRARPHPVTRGRRRRVRPRVGRLVARADGMAAQAPGRVPRRTWRAQALVSPKARARSPLADTPVLSISDV